jgi:hypothetical protein
MVLCQYRNFEAVTDLLDHILIFDHCGRRWWWWWLIPWIENKNRICIYINILACTITSCSKKSSSSSSIKHIDRTCKEDQQISDRIHTQVINVNSLLYIYISWIELITVGYFFLNLLFLLFCWVNLRAHNTHEQQQEQHEQKKWRKFIKS